MVFFLNNYFDKTENNISNIDIFSKMIKERILFIIGEINDDICNLIISQTLYLDNECVKNIYLYINSFGGNISSGMGIYDIIKYIKSTIVTLCLGCAYSMAAFLLSSGSMNHRYSFPNSRIMLHQPLGGTQGQVSDIIIQTKEIVYLKKKINFLFSINLNKDIDFIIKISDRDNFMSPMKALFYFIIDFILLSKI